MIANPPVQAAIDPRLIHRFYADFSASELSLLRGALADVPGDEEGRAQLWEKFKANQAGLFIGRNLAGEMAFFVFFEVRTQKVSSARDFFCGAAGALQSSRDLVETTFPQLEYFAAVLNCQSLTVRTLRPGLVAKLKRLPGWFLDREENGQWIMRKRLGVSL